MNEDEYKEMKKFYNKEINSDGVLEFDNYIIEGGFPRTITLDSRFEKETYVKNVLQDILKKDIKLRIFEVLMAKQHPAVKAITSVIISFFIILTY